MQFSESIAITVPLGLEYMGYMYVVAFLFPQCCLQNDPRLNLIAPFAAMVPCKIDWERSSG